MPEACAIAVMAKAPRAGQVKTRLVPPLSPDMAREMSTSFLRDITSNIALAAAHCSLAGYAAYAPLGLEHLFDGVLAPQTRLILADASGELPAGIEGFGRCLYNAAAGLFSRGHAAACLLNSDSPTLPTHILVDTAQALAAGRDRVVLGAAEDGGYYLIGMNAPHAGLFTDIAWSTEYVAAQTRERVRSLGLELVELPVWYDVDDRQALCRLVAELDKGGSDGRDGYAAPATAACIDRLGLRDLLLRAGPPLTSPTGLPASSLSTSQGSAA